MVTSTVLPSDPPAESRMRFSDVRDTEPPDVSRAMSLSALMPMWPDDSRVKTCFSDLLDPVTEMLMLPLPEPPWAVS